MRGISIPAGIFLNFAQLTSSTSTILMIIKPRHPLRGLHQDAHPPFVAHDATTHGLLCMKKQNAKSRCTLLTVLPQSRPAENSGK